MILAKPQAAHLFGLTRFTRGFEVVYERVWGGLREGLRRFGSIPIMEHISNNFREI